MNDRPPDPDSLRDRARPEMAADQSRLAGCGSCLDVLGRAAGGAALLGLVFIWLLR